MSGHASSEVLKKYGATPERLEQLRKCDDAEKARRAAHGVPIGDHKRDLDSIEVEQAVRDIVNSNRR